MMILQALYFALPMYIANMLPVIGKKIPLLGCPLDGGILFRGKRLLGKNKTWRGLVLGGVGGIVVVYLQQYFQANTKFAQDLSLLDYAVIDPITLGLAMGAGALIGDALKSFFKRQFNKKPGAPWPPFDQIDFIVIGLILSSFVYFPGWNIILIILIITPVLHVGVNMISYKLGMKDVPW